ncbi:unnamed protein product [Dibothriocephalus latus]|uniref:Uncharacterized protein n=1 Tax=Dibothriocephalus latus TaxID=60516 RepID=A0A3P7QH85_DIBLA|nr:unnamed protein product [Dibothriocephalus latus]
MRLIASEPPRVIKRRAHVRTSAKSSAQRSGPNSQLLIINSAHKPDALSSLAQFTNLPAPGRFGVQIRENWECDANTSVKECRAGPSFVCILSFCTSGCMPPDYDTGKKVIRASQIGTNEPRPTHHLFPAPFENRAYNVIPYLSWVEVEIDTFSGIFAVFIILDYCGSVNMLSTYPGTPSLLVV